MNISFSAGRRSATVKVAVIGILILVLLIPIGMIRSLIYDRQQVEWDASADIRSSWGGDQVIAGPILRLPFETKKKTSYGSPYVEHRHAFLVANELTSTATAKAESRYRGIHEVTVYSAAIDMQAQFDLDLLDEMGIDSADVDWSGAEVLLGVSDAQAINELPVLKSAGITSHFVTTTHQMDGLPPQLSADVAAQLAARTEPANFSAQLTLTIQGSGSLQFLPLADNAEFRAASNWPSPSFSGRRLPVTREVTEEGFKATWQTSSLGRKLPAGWVDKEATPSTDDGLFGVRFIQPVGLYQLIFRALKYAVMFVGLTFVTYFLIETVAKLHLHPLQYLLIGLSNTLFYLLLLSLAEHIGFGIAYIASATASVALIASYSATVLAGRLRAVVIGAVLAGLYAFLYLALTAESYALLTGSIGLWFVLATVMYLTRKINWYSTGVDNQKQDVDA